MAGKTAFNELKQMIDDAATKQTVHTSCPECSEALKKHPTTGQLHCPFCGWTGQ